MTRFAIWLAAAAACVFTGTAFADIAAFNAAVKAGDYKKAAVEAAGTWPTLDKSRDDIRTIAREFGFITYVAGDYAGAKVYSDFAVADPTKPDPQAVILQRLVDQRLTPTPAARKQLFEAVTARSAMPGIDSITFAALNRLVAHDFDEGHWMDARADTDLAVRLTAAGGPTMALSNRRFQLYDSIADYMDKGRPETWEQIATLRVSLVDDMQAAPSDEAALAYLPLYWEATAWDQSMVAHLKSRHINIEPRIKRFVKLNSDDADLGERVNRMLDHHPDGEPCHRTLDVKYKPVYPPSRLYKGFVGAVILQADFDDQGVIGNPRILAATPEKDFAAAVLKGAGGLSLKPGKEWTAACGLAHKNHVIIFNFQL